MCLLLQKPFLLNNRQQRQLRQSELIDVISLGESKSRSQLKNGNPGAISEQQLGNDLKTPLDWTPRHGGRLETVCQSQKCAPP